MIAFLLNLLWPNKHRDHIIVGTGWNLITVIPDHPRWQGRYTMDEALKVSSRRAAQWARRHPLEFAADMERLKDSPDLYKYMQWLKDYHE